MSTWWWRCAIVESHGVLSDAPSIEERSATPLPMVYPKLLVLTNGPGGSASDAGPTTLREAKFPSKRRRPGARETRPTGAASTRGSAKRRCQFLPFGVAMHSARDGRIALASLDESLYRESIDEVVTHRRTGSPWSSPRGDRPWSAPRECRLMQGQSVAGRMRWAARTALLPGDGDDELRGLIRCAEASHLHVSIR